MHLTEEQFFILIIKKNIYICIYIHYDIRVFVNNKSPLFDILFPLISPNVPESGISFRNQFSLLIHKLSLSLNTHFMIKIERAQGLREV